MTTYFDTDYQETGAGDLMAYIGREGDTPEPGTTVTRYYYGADGEWQSEELEDPDGPPEADR